MMHLDLKDGGFNTSLLPFKMTIRLNNKTILVTGCLGFIVTSLVMRLLKVLDSGTIVSLENME